jgi:protease YdgD
MLRLLAALLVLLAATALAAPPDDEYRLPGIKGKDDRVLVDSTVFPWRAIGRLNNSIGGHCTASIVGPRLILTAAHCLWNRRAERWLLPDMLHFLPGWSKEAYLAHARGVAIHVAPGFDPSAKPLEAASRDWALVTLDQDVAGTIGKFGVAEVDVARIASLIKAETKIAVAGYAQDRAEVLLVDASCAIRGFDPQRGILIHGCDVAGGVSGAPVFYRDGETYRIVGIHVATMRSEPESLGIAVPSSAFAAAVRERSR